MTTKKIHRTTTCDVESTREYTKEGFLKVKIYAGKVGVQRYSADDLDVEDINGTGFVNVARLPEEVSKKSSLDSLEFKDITISHPNTKEVTADNYKETTAGIITSKGSMAEDGKHIIVDGLIKDKSAISQVEKGKNQVSLGYDHYIDRRTGTLDGESYDFVQTDIEYNHLAIVHRGRAKTATILDHEEDDMSEATELKKENEKLKEQIKNLTADAESAELETTIDMAKTIDEEFQAKDKSAEQIKRELLGDRISSADSLDVVNYAYKMLHKESATPREHKSIPIKVGDAEEKTVSQDADDAYNEYLKELTGEE